MPTIDRIKISQEINFNGMPTWLGLEATLLPGEDEKEGLRQLQKSITQYQTEEAKAYSQSKWGKKEEKPDKVQGWIQVIELASNVPALERFKTQVDKENNPDLTAAYQKQMIKLTNK